MIIEDRLLKIRYVVDNQNPHIMIDYSVCEGCNLKPCVYICPVNNYRLDEDGKVEFSWEACVECGACRIACQEGAITWNYPRGGFGVCYRYG